MSAIPDPAFASFTQATLKDIDVPKIPFEISHRLLNPLLEMIIALTPFAIDTYLPALATIAAELDVDLHNIELSVSSYFNTAKGTPSAGNFVSARTRLVTSKRHSDDAPCSS